MASSFTNLSSLFLIFSILSVHLHARESNFFSKFSRNSNDPTAEDHKNHSFSTEPTKKITVKEQDPGFVRESGNGYGLYGHDTVDSHVSNNYDGERFKDTPYETQESYNYEDKNRENYNGYNNGKSRTRKNYFNRNYGRKNGYGDGVFTGEVYDRGDVASKNYDGVERQGMSDTRFMENGKYFYDVNDEKSNYNYRPDRYFGYHKTGSSRKNARYVNDNVEEEFEDVEDDDQLVP